jgi:GH15 family glucan-1,4-alpha-glucosidase
VICKIWDQPDHGLWEIRSSPVHHTHSKVMAWVGLDRLIKLCNMYWHDAPMKKFAETALLIKRKVEKFGYNDKLKTYTKELNGESLDASALTFSLVGYCDAASDRMVSTTNLMHKNLTKNNLVYRYRNINDGIVGDEGSFGICSFWLAENLAKSGQMEKAFTVFETMLRHAGPTGLLSEEIDPGSGDLLGNYPQGFTHIGLINAALTMNQEHQNYQKDKRKI